MIQAINTRRTSTAAAAHRTSSSSSSESNEQHWGSWHGNKHYSLEVLQNPIRARMCGFGDKDRRPLAPAAVAKMIVKQDDNSIVDVDEIDVAFFVVTVDLWSQDAKHEMNLVLHPSSADRYIPTHVTKPRRRGTAPSAPPFGPTSSQRPDSQASQPSLQALPPPGSAYACHTHPHHQSPYGNFPAQPPPPHTPGMPDPTIAAYPPPHPMYAPHPDHSAWGYSPYSHPPPPPPGHYHPGYPTHPLPSIHSFHRTGTPSNVPSTPGAPAPSQVQGQWTGDHSQQDPTTSSVPPAQGAPEMSTFRGWPAPESSTAVYSDPSTAPPSAPAPPPYEGYGPPPPPVDGGPLYATQPYGPPPGHHAYAPLPPAPPAHNSPPPPPPPTHITSQNTTNSQTQNQNQSQTAPPSPAPSTMPLPRHTYTRTLVGPLSANACRLNDEHRKPGIFFLFQDLSIRTEGTFRLRLRLMNVGAHPAPEPGSTRVMTGTAPILAQTFTEPFIVYSAKRFPGVPDTTALSIAFGNQGQKLPLRNRHGSRQGDRRRRRGESVGSGDESDNS